MKRAQLLLNFIVELHNNDATERNSYKSCHMNRPGISSKTLWDKCKHLYPDGRFFNSQHFMQDCRTLVTTQQLEFTGQSRDRFYYLPEVHKTHYTILYLCGKGDEKVAIALILFDKEITLINYDSHKLLKAIQAFNCDRDNIDNTLTGLYHLIDNKIPIDFVNLYQTNNNQIKYLKPTPIDVEVNQDTFTQLFSKFI